MRFRRKQLVRLLKTGGVYRIAHTPQVCRIETTNAPAYAYVFHAYADGEVAKLPDRTLWVRAQGEMEDGRFEPVE